MIADIIKFTISYSFNLIRFLERKNILCSLRMLIKMKQVYRFPINNLNLLKGEGL